MILGSGDRLVGAEGSDRFLATSENDNTITGGEGADLFWIASSEIPEGANIITDFTNDEDVLGIAGLDIGFEDLSITQDGDNALIGVDSQDLALLEGLDSSTISADQFVFV